MQEVYMSSDEETTTTFSTVAAGDSANMDHDLDSPLREESYKQFQHAMESATDTHVSTCKSTYFFDGGKRFISVSNPAVQALSNASSTCFNSCRTVMLTLTFICKKAPHAW
jgi:hypothetical protein